MVPARTGNDTIDWGQLGVAFTTIASPASWTSALGATGTVSNLGTLERRDQTSPGGVFAGWNGNFAPGDHLLWNQDNGNPVDIHFNHPISLGGAQIMQDFYGAFTGCIQAMGSFGASPVFCVTGNSNDAADNSAVFIGIKDLAGGNITDLLFTTTPAGARSSRTGSRSAGPRSLDNAIAINTVSFSPSPSVVPEPGALEGLLLGTGLLGLVEMARRKLQFGT